MVQHQIRALRCTSILRPGWGLTPRSSGAPTAGHQARSGGTLYIFTSPGLASCRRRPLSSNVRQRNNNRWCASRVSACRRELNSHKAAKPRPNSRPKWRIENRKHRRLSGRFRLQSKLEGIECQMTRNHFPNRANSLHRDPGVSFIQFYWAAFTLFPYTADRWWRLEEGPGCEKLRRGAGGVRGAPARTTRLPQEYSPHQQNPALPNPSLNRSANGRPPWPGLRYAVHFLSPGQGVLPLSPG
jgi:hypothetical protein